MTWYDVHNPDEFNPEDNRLFAFSEADSMDPPVTLIWADSFETAYEVYVDEAAYSQTLEEAKKSWGHIDLEAELEAGYFQLNDKGELVHTESIGGWGPIDEDSPTYLMAAILSVYEAADMQLYAAVYHGAEDIDAARGVVNVQSKGYDAVFVDWAGFDGRQEDLEAITGGRLTPYSQHLPITRWVVWYAFEEEDEEAAIDPVRFYELAKGVKVPEAPTPTAEVPDETFLDRTRDAFQVPPYQGAALFFFPGSEDELAALDIPGIDAGFDPLEDTRPGAGEYPRYGRYVWTRDPTFKLSMDAFGRQGGIVREVAIDFGDPEDFLVVQDQLMSAGVDGFIVVWPPKGARVWEGWKWVVLRGQEELERAKRMVIPPSPEKVRYILQNPATGRCKLKNRLLR